jgi:S-layer protein (TIGR01567 family)
MKCLSFFVLLGLIIACFAVPASAAAIKGSGLWDQEQNMPSTYTWTPATYSGLWYDLDKGVYTENITLKIAAGDRQINAEDAEYMTEYKNIRFAYGDWGSCRVIGWQGEPYFAGYTRSNSGNMSTTQFVNSNISTLSDEKIYPVLLDSKNEKSLSFGDNYTLENGYKLTISDINESGRQFRLILEKNGDSVKNEIVSNNTTFVYERSLDNIGTVPVIAVHVKGLDGSKAVIDGIFQISESAADVNEGRKIGAMEIKTVNDTRITMKNPDRIRLNADSTVTLTGHIKIDVKDASKLKFELVSDPETNMEKTYPDRGMVYDSSNTNKTWNGMNFPGFTYDAVNSTETENLSFDVSGALQRSVSAKQIVYSTNAYNESFNYSGWGSYQAINLGGENYFAGYLRYSSSDKNNTTNFTDSNDSILKDGKVSKVLINNETDKQYNRNSNITLEEGYTLQVVNLTENGSKVNLALKKDGSTVKEARVGQGENFVYEASVGDTIIPIIAVRITSVFSGTNEFIKIGGVFQISTNATDVGSGTTFGGMRVEYTGSNALMFVNKDAVNLSRGSNITLMDKLSLHVADSEELRFFPFNKSGGNNSVTPGLRIEVPETIYPNENIIIKVVSNESGSWKEITGAIIRVNNNTVGLTNTSGVLSYTAGNAGSYEFKAEKGGYLQAAVTKTVSEGDGKLQIKIPAYIFSEDSFRLYVTDENNKNMTGAAVYKNGGLLGTTNDNGMINVTADSTPALYQLTASKPRYISGAEEMKVLEFGPYFVVTNITMPEESAAGKTVKIIMTVENVGREKSTQDVVIQAENKTETKKLTLEPNGTKNLTFRFKPETIGNSSIEVTNQTFSLTVTEKPEVEIPWKWILIGGGILIIIVGAALALMYYKEREGEENPKRKRRGKENESKSVYGGIGGIFGRDSDRKEKARKSKSDSNPSPKPSRTQTASRFSSNRKSPELKNSQKKARKDQNRK